MLSPPPLERRKPSSDEAHFHYLPSQNGHKLVCAVTFPRSFSVQLYDSVLAHEGTNGTSYE